MSRRAILGVALLGVALGREPAAASSLEVATGAATVGAYGLEITIGSTCSGPDILTLDAANSPAQGLFEGCVEVSARDLVVGGAGAVFQAGQRVVLGDGFAVGEGATFEVRLEPLLGSDFASTADPSPIAEQIYNARFYARFDDLSLGASDEIDHFVAYSATGTVELRLVLGAKPGGHGHAFKLVARENGGSYSSTAPGQEIALAPGWNKVELEWRSGAGDGRFQISVNDGPYAGLISLTNDASVIERVNWGAVTGTLTASSGKLQLDGFDSWR